MTARSIAALLMASALCGITPRLAAQQRSFYQQTEYKGQEIGKLTGDIYYARMDDYVSVFMVTSEGIVLVEPIGTEFATWMKAGVGAAFPGAGEVRHL